MRLIALMFVVLLAGFAGQAQAETIRCPPEVTSGIPPTEGWETPRPGRLLLSETRIRGSQFECGYGSYPGPSQTLTRPAPVGATCRAVTEGFECATDPATVLRRNPLTRPPPLSAIPACNVDPTVASVVMTKGARAGQVTVSYEIINAGSATWRSSPGEATVELRVTTSASGAEFRIEQPLPEVAAPGASMLRYTSPVLADPFQFATPHDFSGGEVSIRINYAASVGSDLSNCNNDTNTRNNGGTAFNYYRVVAFMRGSERSMSSP